MGLLWGNSNRKKERKNDLMKRVFNIEKVASVTQISNGMTYNYMYFCSQDCLCTPITSNLVSPSNYIFNSMTCCNSDNCNAGPTSFTVMSSSSQS